MTHVVDLDAVADSLGWPAAPPEPGPRPITHDLVGWLAELSDYRTGHPLFGCDCAELGLDHETRLADLMARKAELLARIAAEDA